jgi:pyroglutamyl-peptidase
MRVLITGFGPFPGLANNPSQLLVEGLADRQDSPAGLEILTSVLPTEYAGAETRIRQLIGDLRPDAVVCIGTAARRSEINLERVALNLDDASIPDNAGLLRQGKQIVPEGPAAYWSTLPLERMRDAIESQSLPVTMSNHAGTYICNHVFYAARHEIEVTKTQARCGLIHVPLAAEVLPNAVAPPFALPLAMLTDAIDLCLGVLAEVPRHVAGRAVEFR